MFAVGLLIIAFVVVALLASPRRLRSSKSLSLIPIGISWGVLLIDAATEWGTTLPFETRWSPIGFALLLASLAPYLSALRIIIIGGLSTLISMSATALSLTAENHPDYWPPVVQLFVGSGMILGATIAGATFSYQIVARTMRWAATASGDELSSSVLGEAARLRILQQEVASLSARALPLLGNVTESGIVTQDDRDAAAALAESLRAELVERSNQSWLEMLTRRLNLTVIDHERLADRMDSAQRSALLSLLTATASEIVSQTNRTVIELRGHADGSTAVAISADRALPDGNRLTLLAPYYVSLVNTVDDVEWDSGDKLRLRFRVIPGLTESASARHPRGFPVTSRDLDGVAD